jgi:probable rRNA maturation factor
MIEIINQQNRYWIRLKKFKDLLKKLIKHSKLKDPEVTLVFVDTKTIRRLNNEFLKRNAPTDVLSFPLGEKGATLVTLLSQFPRHSSNVSHKNTAWKESWSF